MQFIVNNLKGMANYISNERIIKVYENSIKHKKTT